MGGTIEPTTEPPIVVAGHPSFLDSIDWGTKLASNTVKVYFAGNGEVFDGKTSVGWNAYEQQQAMLGFEQFSNVADLHFIVTHDASEADLKLVNKAQANFLGYFNPPGTNGAGVGVFNQGGTAWDEDQPGTGGLEQGGYGFITFIHEFGHALGLAHPHDGGGTSTKWEGVSSSSDMGTFDLNQGIYTTMTYIDGWKTIPGPNNTDDNHGWQGTLMGFDVAVLQQKYGANTSFSNGDSGYALPDANVSGTFWACLWDTGGTDQISYDGDRRSVIDLRAAHLGYAEGSGGYVSYAKGVYGGYTIANGVVIENASGGSRRDVITGNGAANGLHGGDGADRLTGGGGADVFVYTALSESGAAKGTWDQITDFAAGDLIDLSHLGFVWTNHAHLDGIEGALRWKATAAGVVVRGDHDGNGMADFKLLLADVTDLSAGDFLL